jgi:DNA-binding transcriptional MerR regulator
VSAPALRQFQEHSAAIDKIKERLDVLPDEPLSQQDIASFNQGLDKLKQELAEQLKKETEDKEELKKRVDELSKDIQFLKQALESLPKRKWGELFATRVQRWKQRFTLRQLSAGVKVLKLLLPPDSGDALDVVANAIDGVAEAVEKTPGSSQASASKS